MIRPLARVLGLGGVLFVLVAACGEAPPPPPPPRPPPPVEPVDDGVGVDSMGSLSHSEVRDGFQSVSGSLIGCYGEGLARLPASAGNVTFHVGVAADGAVQWAFVERSDLGQQSVLGCMLGAVRGARFARPHGGATEAVFPIDLAPPDPVPLPVEWSPADVEGALAVARASIDACVEGTSGYGLTIYVGAGGTVLDAGATAPDADHLAQAECLAGAARSWTLPDPGPGASAKVTLSF